MTREQQDSKKLAKNTLYLYLRMMFSMVVSLYTSRVVLNTLGVEDYGIYNAVGGIVSMFGIISSSLSASISRNLTFELGRGNKERLNRIFSMGLNIQMIIICIVILLAETIGLWFLNYKMVIPADRILAANWIYQFSLATFAVNLISVPYNASIIAHEKMSTFAYIGILEIIYKLLVAYLIVISPIDSLITYGFLLFCVSVFIQGIYQIYCKRQFEECIYHNIIDKNVFNEMFSFAIWNFIGNTSSILRSQGVNILLNLFFGPIINAARAISVQVNTAINSFASNFMMALTPQITKAYAQGNYTYLLQCIYRGSKFSFFLLYFLSLPVLIETDFILRLWLVDVPDTTVWFVRLTLLYSLVDTYSRTLINANNATGDIKIYQIVIGSINLTVLPIAYVILKLGAPAECTVLVSVIVALAGLYPRIYFNKKHFPITYKDFTLKVLLPTVITSIVGLIIPYFTYRLLPQSLMTLGIVIFVSLISALISIWIFGCTREEQTLVMRFVKNRFLK